jgi:hypothetical protein
MLYFGDVDPECGRDIRLAEDEARRRELDAVVQLRPLADAVRLLGSSGRTGGGRPRQVLFDEVLSRNA